jgi:hypothetical protein
MMYKTPIEGIVKDENGALLNVDNASLDAYKKKKSMNRTVIELQERVDSMESKIDTILKLLTEKA